MTKRREKRLAQGRAYSASPLTQKYKNLSPALKAAIAAGEKALTAVVTKFIMGGDAPAASPSEFAALKLQTQETIAGIFGLSPTELGKLESDALAHEATQYATAQAGAVITVGLPSALGQSQGADLYLGHGESMTLVGRILTLNEARRAAGLLELGEEPPLPELPLDEVEERARAVRSGGWTHD